MTIQSHHCQCIDQTDDYHLDAKETVLLSNPLQLRQVEFHSDLLPFESSIMDISSSAFLSNLTHFHPCTNAPFVTMKAAMFGRFYQQLHLVRLVIPIQQGDDATIKLPPRLHIFGFGFKLTLSNSFDMVKKCLDAVDCIYRHSSIWWFSKVGSSFFPFFHCKNSITLMVGCRFNEVLGNAFMLEYLPVTEEFRVLSTVTN
jgi:hypothetical protein